MSSDTHTYKDTYSLSCNSQVQYTNIKKFAGSKPSDLYGEDYFLRGESSNHDSTDEKGTQLFAPHEEQYYLPRDQAFAAYITRMYKPKTAIVLGCARAYLVKNFRELGIDCKGVDISEWAIKNAPPDLRKHLYVGDICDLTLFGSSTFDVTVATDVFEHIADPDLLMALDEASRITREALIINVPVSEDDLHPDQTNGGDKGRISVFSLAWWQSQLRQRNFVVEGQQSTIHPDNSTIVTLILRKRSLTASRPKSTFVASDSEKKPVDIIMINCNSVEFTSKCIQTLHKNTYYPFNLIVVDNKSTDGSKDYLNSAMQNYSNMQVVFSEINTSYAQGVNIGLQFLKDFHRKEPSPYVLLLNNDTLFLQKNWLSLMVYALENHSDVGIVSPQLLYPAGRIQYAGATFNAQLQPYHIGRFKNPTVVHQKERTVPWATFACALIRRELLDQGLDEQYLLGYFEDVDFCTKVRFDGFKILYCPQVSIYHYEGATTSKMDSEKFDKQRVANAALFAERWADWLSFNRNAYPELYAE
jgi:GT2 family glycosyltransferase